jgi:hypothetical protein
VKAEGYIKWGALAGAIVALESLGDNSLTHYAHKAMEHKIGRWIVPTVVGITAMHLMDKDHDILPEAIDAYNIIARFLDKKEISYE